MAASSELSTLLKQVIDDADRETLQAVLKSMCQSSTECTVAATQRLLVTKNQEVQIISSDSEADTGSSSNPQRKKQKREAEQDSMKLVSKYATCNACHQRFDITTNNKEACRTHDGELEIDEEQFPDDDDVQSGGYIDVKTDWRVKDFPEGFIWNCCEGIANSAPCVIQAHEPVGQRYR